MRVIPCLCFSKQFELVVSSFSACKIRWQAVLMDIQCLNVTLWRLANSIVPGGFFLPQGTNIKVYVSLGDWKVSAKKPKTLTCVSSLSTAFTNIGFDVFCYYSTFLCDMEHYKLNRLVLSVNSSSAIHHHNTADADMAHRWVLVHKLITDLKISRTVANLLQRAKKVVADSPGLVDFAIGLVIFVLNLPDEQVQFFWEIQITEGW